MSTPQLNQAVKEQPFCHATPSDKNTPTITDPLFDYTAYIEKAHAWNNYPLQPWRIAALAHSNKMHAVLERKNLQFDLLDWFEDSRVGAVMRGEKIVSESEFWFQLYRRSIGEIQQHFGNLPVHVVDAMPTGRINIIFGEKPTRQQEKPLPSPIAAQPRTKQKRKPFKQWS